MSSIISPILRIMESMIVIVMRGSFLAIKVSFRAISIRVELTQFVEYQGISFIYNSKAQSPF